MLNKIRPELKTTFFFIGYFITAFLLNKISPSGPCTPGLGAALFLLLIPISIIYTIVLLINYYKSQNKEYLNSIVIVSGIWLLFFILAKYKLI